MQFLTAIQDGLRIFLEVLSRNDLALKGAQHRLRPQYQSSRYGSMVGHKLSISRASSSNVSTVSTRGSRPL